MEQKKKTKAQLENSIKNALVFVKKDKNYEGIFFSDKGLKLETTNEQCVISTGYHRHVFDSFTAAGVSRPYLYTKRVIEIANENIDAIKNEDGYSFSKLLEVLNKKEDKADYNIVVYAEWWLQLIFAPLYSIGETEVEQFMLYEAYLHHIARNGILLSEKTEDITNKQFVKEVSKSMEDFVSGLAETVIFHKKSDDEIAKESMESLAAIESEQAMEAQINGTE